MTSTELVPAGRVTGTDLVREPAPEPVARDYSQIVLRVVTVMILVVVLALAGTVAFMVAG